jgi:putative nucleotidyltransferase with HDIG domain
VSVRKGLILAAQVAVLCTAIAISAASSTAAQWQPFELLALLFALTVVSDTLTVEIRSVRISGAFLALVLSMGLLGPAPAAAIGVSAILIDSVRLRRRPDSERLMVNLVTYSTFPLAGGLIVKWAMSGQPAGSEDGLGFAGLILAVFMITNFLNFVLVAGHVRLYKGVSFFGSLRSVYVTVLPVEFATGLLTAAVAFSYGRIGIGAIGLAAVVLFVFQYLLRAGVAAYERGEELEQRTRELASLQVGLLSTVMQTLSMRDAMTARHSAAVARYAREVARMMELPEREQELIHTAALLHDIGKFIFPDSILLADRKLTDDEWETVKLHPEQGAKLVRRIEGYGPVADIIISHHERVDGKGYPHGLDSDDIPLGSRIISVADTYDVMTSRDSYRRPVSSEAAIVELRRVAGSQLDPMVVERFVDMIESGRVAFRHADEADFERELAFDRRVEAYARPRAAAA